MGIYFTKLAAIEAKKYFISKKEKLLDGEVFVVANSQNEVKPGYLDLYAVLYNSQQRKFPKICTNTKNKDKAIKILAKGKLLKSQSTLCLIGNEKADLYFTKNELNKYKHLKSKSFENGRVLLTDNELGFAVVRRNKTENIKLVSLISDCLQAE